MNLFSVLFCISVVCVVNSAEKDNHQKELHHLRERHHKAETKHHQLVHHKQSFLYRAGNESQQECHWVCLPGSSNSSDSLEVISKGNASLIGILNKSAHGAIVIDYSLQLVALFNGESGTVIIINIRTKTAYKINFNSQTANYVWLQSVTNFNTYFNSITSLQAYYDYAERQGQRINIHSQEIGDIFSLFGTHLSTQENFKLIFTFVAGLQENLKLLYQGNSSFSTQQNLQWFLTVNIAFGELLNNSNINLRNLDVWRHLNLTAIFGESSGVEALLSLLSQLGENIDLASAFRSYITSPQKSRTFLAKISGGSSNGLDGLTTINLNIIQVIEGDGSISKVITSIINYNPSAKGNNDNLSTVIKKALDLVISQRRRYNNSEIWSPIERALQALNNQNFVFRNINISDIIKSLRWDHPREAILKIIEILSKFLPSYGIPEAFKFIINLINNSNSSAGLSQIFPGIDWSNITGSFHSLQELLINYNFTQNSNITKLISQIPLFNQIFQQFQKAVGHEFDINRIVNASTLQHIFGGGLSGFSQIFNVSGIASNFVQGAQHGVDNIVHTISSLGGNASEGNETGSGGDSGFGLGNIFGVGGGLVGSGSGGSGGSGGGNESGGSSGTEGYSSGSGGGSSGSEGGNIGSGGGSNGSGGGSSGAGNASNGIGGSNSGSGGENGFSSGNLFGGGSESYEGESGGSFGVSGSSNNSEAEARAKHGHNRKGGEHHKSRVQGH